MPVVKSGQYVRALATKDGGRRRIDSALRVLKLSGSNLPYGEGITRTHEDGN